MLEFGAVGREIVDRLVTTLFDMLLLLLGERFVTTRLELLPTGRLTVLLGVRLVMTLLELLLLGVRFVTTLLDILLLEFRLVIDLLELLLLTLRLDEMLLELLEEFDLETDLDEEAGLETCRLELRDPLLERDFAAKVGS